MDYDTLIVGAGAAGMESALALGDMGYRVLLVEKEASIGGKMILLSKVFPTLDCASCISTPKMAAAAHHPNITVMASSEIEGLSRRADGSFSARLVRKATHVDPSKCTGCQECETACTVAQPDRFNLDLAAHRAAYIAFPQAIPKKAVIDRRGQSPCSHECPAGVRPHGFISLTRAGRYDEAFRMHMESAPLPGSLGRVCYAPCEGGCARGELDEALRIRGIKRFFADRYYETHPDPEYAPPEARLEQRVAIVGSGPAGLTAAWQLARQGYGVTILEAAEQAGGMLRLGIPAYRLPRDVLDRDLANITAVGVDIRTSSPVTDVAALRESYDAVLLATGAMEPRPMRLEGESLPGVIDCMSFLREANLGRGPDLTGKTVVVVGGGDAAVDPARSAIRMGAARVRMVYRRTRAEMPAHPEEIEAALTEGIELTELAGPVAFLGDGAVSAVRCVRNELGEPDDSGRRRPVAVVGSEYEIEADLVVLSIGLTPTSSAFGVVQREWDGRIVTDADTLQTSIPGVFAAGDVMDGPTTVVRACGRGQEAARGIDAFLQAEARPAPVRQERAELEHILARFDHIQPLAAHDLPHLPVAERTGGFVEVEAGFDEQQARDEASRCLDCGLCSECGECVAACPAGAIDLYATDRREELHVGSVVLATGVELYDPSRVARYQFGRHPNVITSMQMERVLAPTRPYNNVIRPSDGKVPDNIAYVLCVGSRDRTTGNPLCSRVCCMYSLKQAQLLMGAVPLADITIYYIDIRAFGKGYEEFASEAAAMGTMLVKGKVARIESAENGNVEVVYEDIENGTGVQRMEHDLVVLSVGLLPNESPLSLFDDGSLEADPFRYVREVDEVLDPSRTSVPGVFVAGTAAEARDIPDTILHSGAAATQAAVYIEQNRSRP
jgi:heterodisulfide reductase subunit A-like polyferredoxin